MDRRGFLLAGLAAGGAAAVSRARTLPARGASPIVLYSSVDDALLRDVIQLFEGSNDGRSEIKLVGDTEATKTTGLLQRLIAERDRPRADVWWSSEAIGTAMLAREGLLTPFSPGAITTGLPEGSAWPTELRHERWTGFACRGRVLVVNTKRVVEAEWPVRLREFIEPKWRGRIGMARPQFGTTRGQFAAMMSMDGEPAFVEWLKGLSENRVRLFDGNATVVRACAMGEIDVGLTDTDDVWAGKARGWPVEVVFETDDGGDPAGHGRGPGPLVDRAALPQPLPQSLTLRGVKSRGPMLVPNTVGLVAGGPNAEGGRALIEFLLSAAVERLFAKSESRNLPMRPGLAAEFPEAAIPRGWHVDWEKALEKLPRAMELVGEMLGE